MLSLTKRILTSIAASVLVIPTCSTAANAQVPSGFIGNPKGPIEYDEVFDGFVGNPSVLIDLPIQKVYTHWAALGKHDNVKDVPLCGRNETYNAELPDDSPEYHNTFVNSDAWGLNKVTNPRGQSRPVYRIDENIYEHRAVTHCEFYQTKESAGGTAPGAGQAVGRDIPIEELDKSFARNTMAPGMYVIHKNGTPVKAYHVMAAPQVSIVIKDRPVVKGAESTTLYGFAQGLESMQLDIVGDANTSANYLATRMIQIGVKKRNTVHGGTMWSNPMSLQQAEDELRETLRRLEHEDPLAEVYLRHDYFDGLDTSALEFMKANREENLNEIRYGLYKVVRNQGSIASRINRSLGNHEPAIILEQRGRMHAAYFVKGNQSNTPQDQRHRYGIKLTMGLAHVPTFLRDDQIPVNGLPTIRHYWVNTNDIPTGVGVINNKGQRAKFERQIGPYKLSDELVYDPSQPNATQYQPDSVYTPTVPDYVGERDANLNSVTTYTFDDFTIVDSESVNMWGSSRYGAPHAVQHIHPGRVCELTGVCDNDPSRAAELYALGGTVRTYDRTRPLNYFFHNAERGRYSARVLVGAPLSSTRWQAEKTPMSPLLKSPFLSSFDAPYINPTYGQHPTYEPYINMSIDNNILPYHSYVPITWTDPSSGRKMTTLQFMRGRQLLHPIYNESLSLHFDGTKQLVKDVYQFCDKCIGGDLNFGGSSPDVDERIERGEITNEQLRDMPYVAVNMPDGMKLGFNPMDDIVYLYGVPKYRGKYTIELSPHSPQVAPIPPIKVEITGNLPLDPDQDPNHNKPSERPEPREEDLISIRY